jgi:hypothetical protein
MALLVRHQIRALRWACQAVPAVRVRATTRKTDSRAATITSSDIEHDMSLEIANRVESPTPASCHEIHVSDSDLVQIRQD